MRNLSISCFVLLIAGVCGAQTSGPLSPILTTAVSTAGAHPFFGNSTGSTAAPAYIQPALTDVAGSIAAPELPTVTTSAPGAVKVAGTSTTVSGGAISASVAGAGTVTDTAGPLTALQFAIGNGGDDIKVDPGAGTDGAGNITGKSFATTGTGASTIAITGSTCVAGLALTGQLCVASSGDALMYSANAVAPVAVMLQNTALLGTQMPSLSGAISTPAKSLVTTLNAKYVTPCSGGWDGANSTTAIGAGTYTQINCYAPANATITGVKCFTDNGGTTTLNATVTGGSGILTGAVTCTSAGASGTLSATPTVTSGGTLTLTLAADAATKNAFFVVLWTY